MIHKNIVRKISLKNDILVFLKMIFVFLIILLYILIL